MGGTCPCVPPPFDPPTRTSRRWLEFVSDRFLAFRRNRLFPRGGTNGFRVRSVDVRLFSTTRSRPTESGRVRDQSGYTHTYAYGDGTCLNLDDYLFVYAIAKTVADVDADGRRIGFTWYFRQNDAPRQHRKCTRRISDGSKNSKRTRPAKTSGRIQAFRLSELLPAED